MDQLASTSYSLSDRNKIIGDEILQITNAFDLDICRLSIFKEAVFGNIILLTNASTWYSLQKRCIFTVRIYEESNLIITGQRLYKYQCRGFKLHNTKMSEELVKTLFVYSPFKNSGANLHEISLHKQKSKEMSVAEFVDILEYL